MSVLDRTKNWLGNLSPTQRASRTERAPAFTVSLGETFQSSCT